MIIHLADDPAEIAATVDKETGNVIYSITLNSDDEATKEDGGSNSFLWLGVVLAVVAVVLLVIRYIWKKNRGIDGKAKQSEQDASLRYELLKHKEIYKKFSQKGYFSTVRKPHLDVVEGYEINELCDAVSEIFPAFVQFLNGHGLSAKDFQFCCLLKSGLLTLELAEIYCISESAIFKRRQKIKNQLGFELDNRTLDEIFEAIN